MNDTELWPTGAYPLDEQEATRLLEMLEPVFAGQLELNQLPIELNTELSRLYLPLAAWLQQQRPSEGPLLVGLNGSQGSGKSALCNLLQWILESAFDCRTCTISIDDLYLPQANRQRLAEEVHPLLAVRGVPGTHDIPLALDLFAHLKNTDREGTVAIPRFNKATDDRMPKQEWEQLSEPVDLILFEGWCVGAPPQSEKELSEPVNSLEEKEDPDLIWRRYVNEQLEGPYRELFGQLDLLMMLEIPDWSLVYHWRKRQEEQLAATNSGSGIMGDAELQHFIMHYERLTLHQLAVLPKKADLVMHLDRNQRVTQIDLGNGTNN